MRKALFLTLTQAQALAQQAKQLQSSILHQKLPALRFDHSSASGYCKMYGGYDAGASQFAGGGFMPRYDIPGHDPVYRLKYSWLTLLQSCSRC